MENEISKKEQLEKLAQAYEVRVDALREFERVFMKIRARDDKWIKKIRTKEINVDYNDWRILNDDVKKFSSMARQLRKELGME
jgi:hypothetical protein